MFEPRQVLVVLDPDQGEQPALDKVLTLAKSADFSITLLSVEYTQYLVEGYYFEAIDLPSLRRELLDSRQQSLETLAQPLREQGLSVDTLAVWGHPAYIQVVRVALSRNADLVIQHTRRHGAFSRLLLTHDDWQLVRCCPAPLLLVKEQPWHHPPIILAAVDPKHARHKPAGLDHRILSLTTDLAKLTGAAAHVVHSYNESPLSGHYPGDARQAHEHAFAGLLADFDFGPEQQHFCGEAPEVAIASVQQALDADVVIMGAISRSTVADVFIGNTTEKALDFINADIVVVKPPGFVSPVSGS